MAYLIHIDPEVNCVFSKFWGPHDFGEMDQSTSDIIAHPDYKPGMNILRDFREQILPEDLSFKSLTEESQRQQQRHDQLLGRCRWAVLCRDANMYAKVHQFIVTGRLATFPSNVNRSGNWKTPWLGWACHRTMNPTILSSPPS